mmetsp:Transcript_12439/g.34925  ORF Transcript_12439/g.34925 Transcript_12439/m.34925 type:complete len:226 (+) Transcript_12439:874-1551(+)
MGGAWQRGCVVRDAAVPQGQIHALAGRRRSGDNGLGLAACLVVEGVWRALEVAVRGDAVRHGRGRRGGWCRLWGGGAGPPVRLLQGLALFAEVCEDAASLGCPLGLSSRPVCKPLELRNRSVVLCCGSAALAGGLQDLRDGTNCLQLDRPLWLRCQHVQQLAETALLDDGVAVVRVAEGQLRQGARADNHCVLALWALLQERHHVRDGVLLTDLLLVAAVERQVG